jgi:simple sugar transport system ATP-binding protein
MTVAENIAFRTFDKVPIASLGWWMSPGPMRKRARPDRRLSRETPSTESRSRIFPAATSSAPCLPRAFRRRRVLIVANPCFGLDFASVAEIRAEILDQRTAAPPCSSSRRTSTRSSSSPIALR